MRNLLAFLAVAVIVFLAAGWYLGWYTFHSVPTVTGHRGYTIDIDTQKTTQDVNKAGHYVVDEAKEILKKAQDEAAAPPPPAEKKTDPARETFNSLKNSLPNWVVDKDENADSKRFGTQR